FDRVRRGKVMVARRWPETNRGKARRQGLVGALAPFHSGPGLGGQSQRKGLRRERAVIVVAPNARGRSPFAAPGLGRQRLLAWRPDRQRRLHAYGIGQAERREARAKRAVGAITGVSKNDAPRHAC